MGNNLKGINKCCVPDKEESATFGDIKRIKKSQLAKMNTNDIQNIMTGSSLNTRVNSEPSIDKDIREPEPEDNKQFHMIHEGPEEAKAEEPTASRRETIAEMRAQSVYNEDEIEFVKRGTEIDMKGGEEELSNSQHTELDMHQGEDGHEDYEN
jgi:hypothetical protein